MAMNDATGALLLGVDVGNTMTHIGLFRGDLLVGDWKVSSGGSRSADECWVCLRAFLADAGVEGVDGTVIASVVPRLTAVYEEVLRGRLAVDPVVVGGGLDIGIRLRVDRPEEVGGDRIANSVAAAGIYRRDTVVVDLGTATTFDVVSREREYIGGVIAPGIETSASRLFERTARLPQVGFASARHVIGRNTEDAIRSGLFHGAIGQIDGVVRGIIAEWGRRPLVVATGGLSPIIGPASETIVEIDPFLTLKGLRMIHETCRGG